MSLESLGSPFTKRPLFCSRYPKLRSLTCKQDRLRDGHTKMQRSMSGSEVRAAGAVGSEMDPGCKGQGLEGGWEWSRIHRGAQKLLEWNWCEQRVSHRQPGEGLNEAEVRRSPAIHVTPSSNLKPTRSLHVTYNVKQQRCEQTSRQRTSTENTTHDRGDSH